MKTDRHTLKKSRGLLTTLLCVVALSAGCTSSGGNGGASSDEEGEPQSGGVYTYGSVGTQLGYDPLQRSTLDSSMIGIYDTLARFNDKGEVEPFLAESIESTDAQKWTVKLKPDIKFHDDTDFDADAVVFNVERHLDPANASSAAANISTVESVTAIDPLTVEFNLTEPVGSFPVVLTTAVGTIASPTAVKAAGKDYGRTVAVGVGPFKFKEWLRDQRTVLVKNENYWQEGLPYLDEFREIPLSDTQTRLAAFKSNEVDAAWFQEPAPRKWATENPNLATLHGPEGSVGGSGLVFQMDTAPFDDLRVRKAVALAVNVDALDKALFQGTMPRLNGPFSEKSPWYTGTAEWPTFDADAAKALVKEYKADNGGKLAFTLSCHNAPDRRRYVEILQSMFAGVGMDVTLDTPDVAEYVDSVFKKDFQVGCFPKNGADPDPIFYPSFSCDGPVTSNFFGYCNKEVDKVLQDGRRATEMPKRKAAYEAFEVGIAADLPMVWHWADTFSIITGPQAHGFVSNPAAPQEYNPAYLWKE